MNRDKLLAQVRNEYARLTDDERQQHFGQTANGLNAEVYYKNLQNMVENEITMGTFDGFHSGEEIVEAVKSDKQKWLSQWKQ